MVINIPGKLILNGEYGVLHAGQKAIAMAVDRYLTVEFHNAKSSLLESKDYGIKMQWQVNHRGITFEDEWKDSFLTEAIKICYAYLLENNIDVKPIHIVLKSDLLDPISGISYGLGSSGAVVVGIVKSILIHHHLEKSCGIKLTDTLIYKLSVLAHYNAQGNGSGIDVATSSYGNIILYEGIDWKWLKDQIKAENRLVDVINSFWPFGFRTYLKMPDRLRMKVFWLGIKASSKKMVSQYRQWVDLEGEDVFQFCKKTESNVMLMIKGCNNNDEKLFVESIRKQRKVLEELEKQAKMTLELNSAKILIDYTLPIASGKISGAGGGDCMVLFYESKDEKKLESILKRSKALDLVEL